MWILIVEIIIEAKMITIRNLIQFTKNWITPTPNKARKFERILNTPFKKYKNFLLVINVKYKDKDYVHAVHLNILLIFIKYNGHSWRTNKFRWKQNFVFVWSSRSITKEIILSSLKLFYCFCLMPEACVLLLFIFSYDRMLNMRNVMN